MVGRLLVSIGIFAAGYYLGKQMGLTEHIRKDIELERNRKRPPDEKSATPAKARKNQKQTLS